MVLLPLLVSVPLVLLLYILLGKIGKDLFKKLKQQSHEFMAPSNSNIFLIPRPGSTFSCISVTKVYIWNLCPCISTIIGIMNNTLTNCPFPT